MQLFFSAMSIAFRKRFCQTGYIMVIAVCTSVINLLPDLLTPGFAAGAEKNGVLPTDQPIEF